MKWVILIVFVSFLFLGFTVAEEYIEVHSDEFPSGEGLVLKSAWEWGSKGSSFLHNESYELALMCFDKAIELDPSYPSAWYDKGFTLKTMGKYDEALNAFDQAIKINPLFKEAWLQKGNTLYDLGIYDEAIKAYDMAIDIDPNFVDVWYHKIDALKALGRTIEANETLSQADKLRLKEWGH